MEVISNTLCSNTFILGIQEVCVKSVYYKSSRHQLSPLGFFTMYCQNYFSFFFFLINLLLVTVVPTQTADKSLYIYKLNIHVITVLRTNLHQRRTEFQGEKQVENTLADLLCPHTIDNWVEHRWNQQVDMSHEDVDERG